MTREIEDRFETSQPAKIVRKSKRSKWLGLDRIALVVHGIGYIWRTAFFLDAATLE